MALFRRFKSEIAVFLIVFGVGLLALCGWLIFRTVTLYVFLSPLCLTS